MTYCRIGNDYFVRSCISWMKHKAEILMLMVMDDTVLPSVRNYLPVFANQILIKGLHLLDQIYPLS